MCGWEIAESKGGIDDLVWGLEEIDKEIEGGSR